MKPNLLLRISILITKLLKNEGNEWKLGGFVKLKSLSEKEAWNYFKSQMQSQCMYYK